MGQVIAGLLEYGNTLIREHGIISIETKLVPVRSITGAGRGCALLSIGSTDTMGVQKRTDRDLFSVIVGIIKNHNGSVRILNQEGKAEFNIYLPLLANGVR
jgi:hypothetical protein